MIPTVQFEPGTLAVWTTAGTLPQPEASVAAAAMRLAAKGDDPLDALTEISDQDPLRARLLWLISAVWHEKRHYFDTCLTNYGARRFRDFWTLAANFAPLVAEAIDRAEPLWFPVEVYGDPIQRAVRGIAEPPSNVVEIARRARMMKSFMAELDAPIRIGTDQIHLGGEAQMEGLAQVSQLHSIEHSFGIDDLVAATTRYVHRLSQHGPYRAIEAVAGMLGCVSKTPKGFTVANTGLASALFTTALGGQFYGHGPTPPDDAVSPARRLQRMLEALKPGTGRFEMQDEEIAELVDKLARRLWGRTALEEIAADIDAMEEKVDLNAAPWLSMEGLHEVYVDFIALRRRLLKTARELGSVSLLPRAFPTVWRDQLRPWHVVAWPGGGRPDEEGRMFLGVKLDIRDELKRFFPETVGLAWLNTADPPEPFAPQNDSAWLQMLERHGPRALLMLNGRQHRRMVANELERAVKEIEGLDVEIRFHPRFEWPERRDQETCVDEAKALAEYSGRNRFTCDITGDEISPVDAAVLTPWEFRRSGLKQRFQETAGPFGEIQLLFDWSDWVVRRDLIN
jgi:hypothetical protein